MKGGEKGNEICGGFIRTYCEILNMCGINFLWLNENDVLAHFNFGVHVML